ncbi:MAG: hypothetical protein KF715_02865 [Candidatus Didemnitutus sp.]|nr:hypothetical protein [Candidatus Didemnitutus sp.]
MTDATPMLLMNFRIPSDLKIQFRDTCRRRRTRMSTELVRFVTQFLKLDHWETVELERMKHRLDTNRAEPRRLLIDPNTGLPLS